MCNFQEYSFPPLYLCRDKLNISYITLLSIYVFIILLFPYSLIHSSIMVFLISYQEIGLYCEEVHSRRTVNIDMQVICSCVY
jgi:hypothetical protein